MVKMMIEEQSSVIELPYMYSRLSRIERNCWKNKISIFAREIIALKQTNNMSK
jgi:hypothetical protein